MGGQFQARAIQSGRVGFHTRDLHDTFVLNNPDEIEVVAHVEHLFDCKFGRRQGAERDKTRVYSFALQKDPKYPGAWEVLRQWLAKNGRMASQGSGHVTHKARGYELSIFFQMAELEVLFILKKHQDMKKKV